MASFHHAMGAHSPGNGQIPENPAPYPGSREHARRPFVQSTTRPLALHTGPVRFHIPIRHGRRPRRCGREAVLPRRPRQRVAGQRGGRCGPNGRKTLLTFGF